MQGASCIVAVSQSPHLQKLKASMSETRFEDIEQLAKSHLDTSFARSFQTFNVPQHVRGNLDVTHT